MSLEFPCVLGLRLCHSTLYLKSHGENWDLIITLPISHRYTGGTPYNFCSFDMWHKTEKVPYSTRNVASWPRKIWVTSAVMTDILWHQKLCWSYSGWLKKMNSKQIPCWCWDERFERDKLKWTYFFLLNIDMPIKPAWIFLLIKLKHSILV